MRLQETFNIVTEAVAQEIERQEGKWGPQFHDVHFWNSIVDEEDGERVKAMLEADVGDHVVVSADDFSIRAHEAAWNEAMKETVENIACLVQFYEECRRRRDNDREQGYSIYSRR